MTPFEVYKQYVMIKLHFNSDTYDYIKFCGKSRNISYNAYDKRKDKYYFEKIAKKYSNEDIVPFFVSNFVNDPNMWSGDLASFDKSAKLFREWKGKVLSLKRLVKDDMKNVVAFIEDRGLSVAQILEVPEGSNTHPILIRFLFQGMISIETVIYLNNIFTFIEKYDTMLVDPLWEHQSKLIKNYSRFLHNIDWKHLL